MRLRSVSKASAGLAAAAFLLAALPCAEALAQAGPFGVGVPETGGGGFGTGPFGRLMMWIATEQAAFYRGLTGALRALKADGTAAPTLAGLSFLYGVFHAAGPGHGKVVLTSYLLANEATLKRGIGLAFAAAAAQATTAVMLVMLMALILRATSIELTQATRLLELASYLAIACLGAGLIWSKLGFRRRRAHSLGAAATIEGHDPDCLCCGASHMPHPRAARGSAREALAAVLAIGARPCTGAIIVLVFALSQGLVPAGLASVYVMGLGTAITVSALASIAVYAKRSALRLAGMRANRAVEIGGAATVLILGLMLFFGALAAG